MTNSTHPQQVAKSASAKKMLMSDLMQTVGILPILILIVAVFGFIAPNFFTESNLLNITRQASINIVLAAGMTFIILTGGDRPLRRLHSGHHGRGGDGGVVNT